MVLEEDLYDKRRVQKGIQESSHLGLGGEPNYKIEKGYAWQSQRKVPWVKLIWARTNLPRNAFISWVLISHRLPAKQRLAKFQNFTDIKCFMCYAEEEIEDHLFYACNYA